MKRLMTLYWAAVVIWLLVACSTTKKTARTNSYYDDEITVWIDAKMGEAETFHDEVGVYSYVCYAASFEPTLNKVDFGHITNKWESFCASIEGFDYEEGNYYQLQLKKSAPTVITDHGIVRSTWNLVAQLTKEKDVHYERRETITAWIGPRQIEEQCSHPLAGPNCKQLYYQVQYDEYNEYENWDLCSDLISVPDYEEGFIYKIEYVKKHYSEFERNMLADHHGYDIESLKVLSKKKMSPY